MGQLASSLKKTHNVYPKSRPKPTQLGTTCHITCATSTWDHMPRQEGTTCHLTCHLTTRGCHPKFKFKEVGQGGFQARKSALSPYITPLVWGFEISKFVRLYLKSWTPLVKRDGWVNTNFQQFSMCFYVPMWIFVPKWTSSSPPSFLLPNPSLLLFIFQAILFLQSELRTSSQEEDQHQHKLPPWRQGSFPTNSPFEFHQSSHF